MERWRLLRDGELLTTHSSWILPVRQGDMPAMLKVARIPDEEAGYRLLTWWDGQGAARVFASAAGALLMERASGAGDLAQIAWSGQDDEACRIYDSLCQQQWITENGSMITLSGIQYFHEMGIDVPSKHSRKICCACLDWSERRFHLGGYVGAALFSLYESKGWLTRHLGYREVTITEKGYAAFKTHFHI
ncbi:aminoglycoside phosphotransferase family protein [Haemophilus influenzae]|uniref:aminoglycoside phosphotransferase family protein n=1 Tax=Haemophilus influenzae TaxID=727 RepID=UPI003DA9D45D